MHPDNSRLVGIALLIANTYLALFCLLNIVSLIRFGHLTPPFMFDWADTWMDFFNVNMHSHSEGLYTEFKSFYSPFNIYIAKLWVPDDCIGVMNKYDFRECAMPSAYIFEGIFLIINVMLMSKILGKCKNKYQWLILFSLSFPMLYAVERGNYIVIAMALMSLFVLAKGGMQQIIILSLLPLVKYYLLLLYSGLFISKAHLKLLLIAIFLICLNVLFSIINNIPNTNLILNNLLNFSAGNGGVYNLWNATNIKSIGEAGSYLLGNIFSVQVFKLILVCTSFICFIKYYIFIANTYKNEFDIKLNALIILILFFIISPTAGFYSLILLLPFFAYYISKNSLRVHEQFLLILMLLPYPFNLFRLDEIELDQSKYIANIGQMDAVYSNIIIYYQLQSLLIPILLIIIFWSITNRSELSEWRLK